MWPWTRDYTNKKIESSFATIHKKACMPKKYKQSVTSAVKGIKKQIDQKPTNGSKTAALASEAGISRNVLQEVFKAKYGTSIGQYKLQLRMREAKQQLKSGK